MLTISLVLSIAASALQVWLIVRLFFINRHREYPFLIAYNVLSIFTFLAVISVMSHAVAYFLTYWIGEILLSVVALLVILAVFKPAAEVLYLEHPWGRLLLPLAIVAVVAIAVRQTIYRPLRHTLLGHAASGMYSFVLGVLFLEAIILLACLALAFSKTIPWGRYDFAIVAGFGLSAITKLITFLLWWNYGSHFEIWVRYVVPSAGTAAALIWVVAFSHSEPPTTKREPDATELQRLIDLMQEHTEFVRQLLKDPRLRRQPLPVQPR